jgi:hypothetical protein
LRSTAVLETARRLCRSTASTCDTDSFIYAHAILMMILARRVFGINLGLLWTKRVVKGLSCDTTFKGNTSGQCPECQSRPGSRLQLRIKIVDGRGTPTSFCSTSKASRFLLAASRQQNFSLKMPRMPSLV